MSLYKIFTIICFCWCLLLTVWISTDNYIKENPEIVTPVKDTVEKVVIIHVQYPEKSKK